MKRHRGLSADITRRDFIGTSLVGTGALLTAGCAPRDVRPDLWDAWTGYGGVGDYSRANGNTKQVMDAAHLLRDGAPELIAGAADTGETFDLIVVGGGFSGLGAAFQFNEKTGEERTCLILENHSMFGGEARENEFEIDGYRLFGPQGSNAFIPPEGYTTLSDTIWRRVGLPMTYEFAEREDSGTPIDIAFDSYDAMFWAEQKNDVGYYFPGQGGQPGTWQKNIFRDGFVRTPWPDVVKQGMNRAFNGRERFHDDEGLGPWLDSMTYKHYLEQVMGVDPRVTSMIDPVLAISNYGFGCDVITAYGPYLLAMPGTQGYTNADTYDLAQVSILSFPGGNTTYARHIVHHLIPNAFVGSDFESITQGPVRFDQLDQPGQPTRIRLSATALHIEQNDEMAVVTYVIDGKAYSARAKSVVMATSGNVTRRTVATLPESIETNYAEFHHGPVLVANLALNNWRFLERMGIGAARWYEGFGFFGSIRQPMKIGETHAPFHPDKPMVMTFYVPLHRPGYDILSQGMIGRAELLAKSFADYEIEIREHMSRLFSGFGFDAERDIAGLVLNRWGHAYIAPQPGFYFGGEDGQGLAAPMKAGHRRIFFGHSELGARMNYRNALAEGGRAGEQAAGIV